MKKELKRRHLIYFYVNGKKWIIDPKNKKTYPRIISGNINSKLWGDISELRGNVSGLRGDISDLRGDITGLRGDITGLRGDISGLWGDISGLYGDISGLRGNIDDCLLTNKERKDGVDVVDLIVR